LRAVLEHAEICFDEFEGPPGTAFQDVREFLFDSRFDGIDDPEIVEGAQLGVGPLDPSAWFEPLYDGRPVHPMAE